MNRDFGLMSRLAGGGVQTLEALEPIEIDNTDPKNPIILLDIESADEGTPALEDPFLFAQGEDTLRAPLSALGSILVGIDYFVNFTDDAANDLAAYNAAIAAVGAGAGNIKTIKAFGTLRMGATLPSDADYIRWDFTSLTAIKKDGTWSTTLGWISGIQCSVIGAGRTPTQWISGTGGPVFGGSILTLTGFDFDATWDGAAAAMMVFTLATAVANRTVLLHCSGEASTANRCSWSTINNTGAVVQLSGNWFNGNVDNNYGTVYVERTCGTATQAGNQVYARWVTITGNTTASGSGIFLNVGAVSASFTCSATHSTIVMGSSPNATVTSSGTGCTLIIGACLILTVSGTNQIILANSVSRAITLTGSTNSTATIRQTHTTNSYTHFLGSQNQISIAQVGNPTQTYSASDGCIVTFTGGTDGGDVVLASTAGKSFWDINLTGAGAHVVLNAGAEDNVIRVQSEVEPTLNASTTYTNSVQWFDRGASGAGRWVSVRRPNRVLQIISQAYIASLGAVAEYDVPITEALPAGAQVIAQRVQNLGDAAAGVTDLTAQNGIAGNTNGFTQEASVLAANACADVRGTLVCGSYSVTSSPVCKLKTTGGNLGDVTGLANGLLVALDYIA